MIIQDQELSYVDWTDRLSQGDGQPLDIHTSNVKYINCVIHDFSNVGLWADATGAEMYGCIVYHNGWSGEGRGHGHGLYVQNDTPKKVIKDCIIFDNFGWGIHAYTEGGKINNIEIDGCVCFGAGSLYGATGYNNILVGGYQVAENITIRNSMTYKAGSVNVGYSAGANNVVLENNYFQSGIQKVKVTNLTESGNYYGLAVGNRIFLRPNEHDSKRAHLIIYNEAQAKEITVDVSSIYKDGDEVQARNVQDYFSDIQTLTVTAGKITVSMTGRTVSAPVGWAAPPTTFPQFGCFVLVAA